MATSLMLKALEAMGSPLRIEIDSRRDALEGLTPRQRRQWSERLLRRKHAEVIAEQEGVDVGDVEHVLYNLTLRPWQRLARSFERAGPKRVSS